MQPATGGISGSVLMVGFAFGRRGNLIWLLQLRHLMFHPAQAGFEFMNAIKRSLEVEPIDG